MIKTIDIDEKIDGGHCPPATFCEYATTFGGSERACLRCWIRYCDENNFGISYKSIDKRIAKRYNRRKERRYKNDK